jgi:ubiquinone/menaquinone biosynthesis C-methylase UbiE
MADNFIKKLLDRLKAREGELDLSNPETIESIYRLELGEDYSTYWDNMAASRQLAYFAVAGLPFGQSPNDKNIEEHGKRTADIITKKLEIGPGDEVLEVGVGVGRLAGHIAAQCKKFTGIDISAKMIAYAGERLKGRDNIKLIHHQKSDLSLFADNSFDKVYIQVVLIHLDREDAFNYMRESYRALKPGGRAWFQFYNVLHPDGFKEFLNAANLAVKLGGKLRGRVHCYTADEVRKLAEAAGFKIIEGKSHLEKTDQKFDFTPPDTVGDPPLKPSDWNYYLIAVCEKPEERKQA